MLPLLCLYFIISHIFYFKFFIKKGQVYEFMIKRTSFLLLLLCLCFTYAFSQETQMKPLSVVTGTIVEIDKGNKSFIIEVKNTKTEKTILTEGKTVFVKNMIEATFQDFKVSDIITVSSEDTQTQEIKAKAIYDSESAFLYVTGQSTIKEYNGKIIDIKDNIVTIVTKEGKKTFDITDAKIMKNLKEVTIKDFKSGDEIYAKACYPGLLKHEPPVVKPAFLKDPLSYVTDLLENNQGPLVLRGKVTEVVEKKSTLKIENEKVLANKSTVLLVPPGFTGFSDLKGKSVIVFSTTNPIPGRTYVAKCIFVEDALATVIESLTRVAGEKNLESTLVAKGKIVKVNKDKGTIMVNVNGKDTIVNISFAYIQDSADPDRANLSIDYLREGDTVEAEGYDISTVKMLYLKQKAQSSSPRNASELNIYFFTDLLGYLSPFETGGSQVTSFLSPEKQNEKRDVALLSATAGGFAQLTTKYKELSGKSKNNLLLCNGNFLHGTSVASATDGEAVIDCLNAIGVKAAILGDQDFYKGKEQLVKLVKKAKFSVLGANVMAQGTNNLLPGLKPYVVIEFNGIKVGILGIVNPNVTSLVPKACLEGISIADPKVALVNYYSKVSKEADVLVLLLNQGYYDNYFMANDFENILPGADKKPVLIIGGEGRDYTGSKPMNANNMLLIEGGTKGRYLSQMSFGFNKNFTSSNYALYTYLISPGLIPKPDGDMEKLIATFNAKIPAKYSEVLGKSLIWLSRVKKGESGMGDLVTDAMLKKSGADVALYNGRGLRNDIFEGDITYGLLYSAIPYDFQMEVIEMTGKDLKEVLEQGFKSGEFLQVAGLRVTYKVNPAKYSDKRILDLTIGGKAVTDSQVYKVAISTFLLEGGEGYRTFTKCKVLQKDGGLIRDIVADYIKELKEIRMGAPERIIGQ